VVFEVKCASAFTRVESKRAAYNLDFHINEEWILDWYSEENLTAVFEQLKKSRVDAITKKVKPFPTGWDRRTEDQFEKQRVQHISAASRKLATGRYIFRPFVYIELDKSDGGKRKIAMSGIRDRIVQQAMYAELYGPIEEKMHYCAHAYRKGLSPHTAIAAVHSLIVSNHEYLLLSDFSKFFANERRGLHYS
jgi:retron-type reverse transcriptase